MYSKSLNRNNDDAKITFRQGISKKTNVYYASDTCFV